MECNYQAEDLLAYVDNELPAVDIKAIDRHLETCAHCRGEVDELRNVTSLLGMLPDIEFPEDVRIRLSNKLKEDFEEKEAFQQQAAPLWTRLKVAIPVFATFLCLLFVGGHFLRNQPQSPDGGQVEPILLAQRATIQLNGATSISINNAPVVFTGKNTEIALREDDTVAIGQGGPGLVEFPGDIFVELLPGARFTVYDRWVDLKQGKGHFKLAKQHKGFQVTTPTVTVTVVGTTFSVGVEKSGASEVSLFEGIVDFETRQGKNRMKPGQTLKTTADGGFELTETSSNVDQEILFNGGQTATEN